jgi:nucleotide-binding universal stress UspA family protein
MYRRILVPLDGSRFSEHALPYAVSAAMRLGADLELMHVHHHQEYDSNLSSMPQYRYRIDYADMRHDEDMMTADRNYLEQTAADIELRYGMNVRTRVVTGLTAEAIAEEAQNIVADLVVMATHARHGVERMRFGHMAAELIQYLNVPSLCVHPQDADAPLAAREIRRVLVTLDGSEFSEQILDVAAPLIQGLGAHVTLLHVVAPRPLMMTGLSDLPRLIPNRDEAQTYLAGVAARVRGRIPEPALIAVEAADAAESVANIATHGGYDLVAMATHGRSGLSRLLLGSSAEQVLEKSPCPVLLYRPRMARLPESSLTETFWLQG